MSDTSYGPMRPDPSGQTAGFMGPSAGSYNPYPSYASGPSYMNASGALQHGTDPGIGQYSNTYDTSTTLYDQNKANLYGLGQAGNEATVNQSLNAALGQSQRADMGIGIYGAQAGADMNARFLNQNAGFSRQLLANQVAGNQVDIGANARQPGFLTSLHNIAGQQFDLSRQGEQANADQNRRALESQATARGAFTSVGAQQGRYDIAGQLLRQTQGTNLDQQGETAKYFESMAQTNDQKQRLDLAAKDLGINGQQLEATLQQGLERNGLSRDMTVADLMQKINSSNLQEAVQARQIYQDAMTHSDYYSRLAPNTSTPSMGSSGQLVHPGG